MVHRVVRHKTLHFVVVVAARIHVSFEARKITARLSSRPCLNFACTTATHSGMATVPDVNLAAARTVILDRFLFRVQNAGSRLPLPRSFSLYLLRRGIGDAD